MGQHRDRWQVGGQALFTYSFPPDPASEISGRLAHRTGQAVTIVSGPEGDGLDLATFAERMEEGVPSTYGVRFPDGHEDTAFEDELTNSNY